MYKVLIADDEVLVRTGIVKSINWTEHGFEEPREAVNGLEALELLKSMEFDVALVDIKMPCMDGIELIEKARETGVKTEFIILSCHNDFSYIKYAFKYDVCDYLFKLEMMPDDIVKSLGKAIGKLESKLRINDRVTVLEKALNENISYVKESFITDIIKGKEVDNYTSLEELDKKGLRFHPTNLTLIVINLDNPVEIVNSRFLGNEYLLKDRVLSIIDRVLCRYDDMEFLQKSLSQYLIIYSNRQEVSLKNILSKASEVALSAVEALGKDINIRVVAGISRNNHNIASLRTAYEEAILSIDKSFLCKDKKVFIYGDTATDIRIQNIEINTLLEKFLHNERESNTEKIKNLFQDIKVSIEANQQDILEISANIIGIMLKKAMEYNGVIEAVYSEEPQIYSRLYRMSSMEEVVSYLTSIAEKLEGITNTRYRNEINAALKYIGKRVGDQDLSLEDVANHVNMSKGHFSRVFKMSMEESFIDYLIRLRIENAKKLYRTTGLKIYQIAEKVGYPDWRYFNKLFKKHTGTNLSSMKK